MVCPLSYVGSHGAARSSFFSFSNGRLSHFLSAHIVHVCQKCLCAVLALIDEFSEFLEFYSFAAYCFDMLLRYVTFYQRQLGLSVEIQVRLWHH
jgi:hypothetical protein